MKSDNDEIALTGKLAEFRTTLLHEINAAPNNASSSAVQLINGRKIAQVGSSYQYIFDVENALNLPGDTPGDLYLPGRSPIEVIIISIEGMAITLSIPENLGKFVPNAQLQSNLAFLMRKLIERITVSSSLNRNITFIGGPPGTGKTQTIGSIGKELYLSDSSPSTSVL